MSILKLCSLIFVAGGLGALSRFGLTTAIARLVPVSYPLGTFAANILGSFLFGFVWEMQAVRMLLADTTRVVLCVGFMGSFTTFSSLIFESFNLAQVRPTLFVFNIVAQVVVGFAALWLGMRAADLL